MFSLPGFLFFPFKLKESLEHLDRVCIEPRSPGYVPPMLLGNALSLERTFATQVFFTFGRERE